jgi:hypothetical protein
MTYPEDDYRPTRNPTPWVAGIIIALALLAIAYLVFTTTPPPLAGVNAEQTR